MEQDLVKDNARRVPQNELHAGDKPLWYLPHHPVFNKPGKTRVVFYCAEKHRGTSLNDQFLTGPDLTNSIIGVLTRFREEQVALSADIECMFHQVRVIPGEQDTFRFLWWPDDNLSEEPVDHRMEAELLKLCIAKESRWQLRWIHRWSSEDRQGNFHVDYCLKSVKSSESAVKVADQNKWMNENFI